MVFPHVPARWAMFSEREMLVDVFCAVLVVLVVRLNAQCKPNWVVH